MRKLIITEKANAARRISTILSDGKSHSSTSGGVTVISFESGGDDYDVVSLRGHIIELDYPKEYNDWSSTSPVDLVYAPQVKTVRVKSILNMIKDLATKADEIIIATDYDREGELIGMETVREAGADMGIVRRAKFSALTKGEVENAFSNLTDPDKKLADAAEARQIIDLAWGAVLTRLISLSSGQVGKNFMSVGRVQSPTLKLLVDRHEEIESFVPKPYWELVGKFGILAFKGSHASNPFWDKDEAEAILAVVADYKEGTVKSFEVTPKEEYRPAPFDTTQMQVEANKIGIPPTTAMKLAEDLYTGGYISYPRTENTEYPKTLNLRSVLEKLKDGEFKSEAEDKWKLYELIVRRFLATVAPNAESEVTHCVIDVGGEDFNAEGYVLKKKGWKKYYGKYIKSNDSKLPALKVGDTVDIRSMGIVESETKPPYRYNQGSLIQEMDRLQLGTKSTRHDIIGKLYSRNYVQGNYMIPTPSGIALTKALENHGGGITEPDMTAKLESDMLKIMDGERTLDSVVTESQDMLHDVAQKISDDSEEIGSEIKAALRSQQHIGICPSCGNNMTIKRSKNGNFIGCDGYPDCKRAYPVPRGALIQTVETTCPVCGLPQLRIIRKGNPPSLQCIDPKCPSNTEKNDLGPCPTCEKGRLRIMYSKAGKRFAGCSEWPACTQTYPLRPRGSISYAGRQCTICKAPMINLGNTEECINPDCPGRKKSSRSKKTEKTDAEKAAAPSE